MIYYETERLILREWQASDAMPYIKLNQDPEVLKYFPALHSEQESLSDISKFMDHFRQYGYSLYACELKSNYQFIGFVGLNNRFDMPFSPCTEIGWRLIKEYWNNGFATELAIKCLEIGFTEFNLTEVVAFTAKINKPSAHVMQKIGMFYDSDFYHYKLAKEHPLCLHVLYRISRAQYFSQSSSL